MSARLGPLDRGQRISTLELLSAIDEYGPHWPAVLAHYTIEAVSVAVGREISARNLYDGRTLTAQGARVLTDLRRNTLDAATRGGGVTAAVTVNRDQRLCASCKACGDTLGCAVDDPDVFGLVERILSHRCSSTP